MPRIIKNATIIDEARRFTRNTSEKMQYSIKLTACNCTGN